MGRSFESVRMGVKDVSARWLKASKALKKEDQICGQKVAEMAKKHSSELGGGLSQVAFDVVEFGLYPSERNHACALGLRICHTFLI